MKYLIFIVLLCYSALGFCDDKHSLILAKGVKEPLDVAVKIIEPQSSSLIYDLPIESPQGVTISQGPLNLDGSHGYLNCLFALDFASIISGEKSNKSIAGKILAAREGIVMDTYDEGASGFYYNCDSKGEGFGNWIAIQHESNEVSFYAHLDKITVQKGDFVRQGQEIGIEGSTGRAGFRHLHFSVHRLIGNTSENFPPYSYQYECIPYTLRYVDQGIHTVDIRDFSKIHAKDGNHSKLFPVSSHSLLSRLNLIQAKALEATFTEIDGYKIVDLGLIHPLFCGIMESPKKDADIDKIVQETFKTLGRSFIWFCDKPLAESEFTIEFPGMELDLKDLVEPKKSEATFEFISSNDLSSFKKIVGPILEFEEKDTDSFVKLYEGKEGFFI